MDDIQTPLQRIVELLEKNYEKNVTLHDAAGACSLSPKYVSRFFKKEMRKNFSAFRIELRMEHAKKMLLLSTMHVNEIADKVGYGNPEAFMKIFKRSTGLTPTEYRKTRPSEGSGAV